MNKVWSKQAFLEELRGYLIVLEDQEQEDIIEEYSQHIDMKLQKGLSEEEAIRDFGSMKELAAEILEAYHVKPEFRQQKPGFHLQEFVKVKTDGSVPWFRRMGNFLKEKSVAAARGMRAGFLWIGRKCRAFAGWLVKPYRVYKNRKAGEAAWEDGEECSTADGSGLSGQAAGQSLAGMQERDGISEKSGIGEKNGISEKDEMHGKSGSSGQSRIDSRVVMHRKEGTKDMAGSIGRCFRKAGHGIMAVWSWFFAVCLWVLRMMWNAAWLLFALFCAVMAMFVLAGLGATLVLLAQRYPLMGLSLIELGGLLCFGSLAVWAYSMMIRKKTAGTKIEDGMKITEKESGEEVQYE